MKDGGNAGEIGNGGTKPDTYTPEGIFKRGYGISFGFAPDPRKEFIFPAINTLYKNCTSKTSQVGFDTWFQINSIWEDNTSIQDNITFLNMKDNYRIFYGDDCSECPYPLYPHNYSIVVKNVSEGNKNKNFKIIL